MASTTYSFKQPYAYMKYETWPSNELQICPYDLKKILLKHFREKIKGTRMQIGKGNK